MATEIGPMVAAAANKSASLLDLTSTQDLRVAPILAVVKRHFSFYKQSHQFWLGYLCVPGKGT